jgi:PKD repeat protein
VSGANFTFAPAVPKVGNAVTFTGTAVAGTVPITYTWSFDDGGTGVGAVISHIFPLTATAHTYTVALTAANACPSQVTASHTVTVWPHHTYLPILLKP